MNLTRKWGDDPAAVSENLRRLAERGGFEPGRLFVAKQVHGDRCIRVEVETTPEAIALTEADALVTAVPGRVLAVSTADCVPLLLASADGRAVAAAHAGWRGTKANIAAVAVRALAVMPSEIYAALGPSICVKCFEVGEEVAAEFEASLVRRDLGPKPHVDLQLANVRSLEAAGVPRSQIDGAPPCTMCEPERFFSYRRDHGKTGAHLSYVICRGGDDSLAAPRQ